MLDNDTATLMVNDADIVPAVSGSPEKALCGVKGCTTGKNSYV
jgi:hypothetical protein